MTELEVEVRGGSSGERAGEGAWPLTGPLVWLEPVLNIPSETPFTSSSSLCFSTWLRLVDSIPKNFPNFDIVLFGLESPMFTFSYLVPKTF